MKKEIKSSGSFRICRILWHYNLQQTVLVSIVFKLYTFGYYILGIYVFEICIEVKKILFACS